jgi:hypothetical protein
MKPEDKSAATEEQIKSHNEAEEARWQGDYNEEDLAVPYKREEESKKDDENDKSSKDKQDNKEDIESPVVEEYSEPEPIITAQDPGDYKPADYSFEVTLKDGKTIKVTTPEEAENLADDPDNFETPKQLMDFINKQNKMRTNLDRDYEKWESQKKTFTEQLETETQRRETIDNFVGEFQYLVSKGKLPAVSKEYIDADWSDPKVAEQPGVKEQIAILNYMEKENVIRAKAKVKSLTSVVDAYNAWKEDETEQERATKAKEAEEAKIAAGEARKVASSRVAGVSPSNQGTYIPKGIAVGNPHIFDRGAAQWDN